MYESQKRWAERNPNYQKEYYQKYRERYKAKQRKRYWSDPLAAKEYELIKNYGITLADLKVLEQKQNNLCAICDEPKPLHVDHCHKTGKVRGLLCNNCNNGLGRFKDNASRLRRAADYINLNEVEEV